MRNPVKLICVTQVNNNKFYDMEDNGDGTFTATYGRIGQSSVRHTYPISKWDAKYNEKIYRKGYADVSELALEEVANAVTSATVSDINDSQVRELVRALQGYAHGGVRRTYTVSARAVTASMVDEAQSVLNALSDAVNSGSLTVTMANAQLLQLYRIIPRRMDNVKHYLINDGSELDKHARIGRIIRVEQDNIDMVGQQAKAERADQSDGQSVLEAMGIDIARATQDECQEVYAAYPSARQKCSTVFRITNHVTLARFADFISQLPASKQGECSLLWHGSRDENWLSILENGLLIRPTGVITTGSMFGNGIYFASELDKSLNYAGAYCAIFTVFLGNKLKMSGHDHNMSASELARKGNYDSVWGVKGYTKSWGGPGTLYNDEFIVYSPAQATISYLLEVRPGYAWR